MRVCSRIDFLKLPEGTAYAQGKQWFFGGIQFKADMCGDNDWWSLDPHWISAHDKAISCPGFAPNKVVIS